LEIALAALTHAPQSYLAQQMLFFLETLLCKAFDSTKVLFLLLAQQAIPALQSSKTYR